MVFERGLIAPWVVSVLGFGATSGITGYCLGVASRPALKPPEPPPVVVEAPEPEPAPARGDQSRFVRADPVLARWKAEQEGEWWIAPEMDRPSQAPEATGIVLIPVAAGAVEWAPWIKGDQQPCGHVVRPTGRISLDVEPLDLKHMSQRRWGLLEYNCADAIRLAQRFNAGDLVEVEFGGPDGFHTVWFPHESVVQRPAPVRRPARVKSKSGLGGGRQGGP